MLSLANAAGCDLSLANAAGCALLQPELQPTV